MQIRDLETALDEEARRHKETVVAVEKKIRKAREAQMQLEEEHSAFAMAEDTVNKLAEKLNIYKRQVAEAVSNHVS